MKKSILLIYNPKAGKSQIKYNLSDIIDIFTKAEYEVVVYPTQKAEDATAAVLNRRDGFDMIVCSGGDGTLDEVVAGMMKCKNKLPIGYIPAGSTNDFAKSLKIPKNMKKAAEAIVAGKNFPCDIGLFNEKSFVYIAAFGILTEVSYKTNQDMKNVLGHMAYVLEGMKTLPAVKPTHMKVIYEDVIIEDDFIFGMVTNSVSVGGFKGITGKNVTLDDGVFEVTLIKMPKNPIALNETLASLVNRKINTEQMYCFKTDKVSFISEREVSWTLDGENGGTHKEVIIENRKQEIEIVIPS